MINKNNMNPETGIYGNDLFEVFIKRPSPDEGVGIVLPLDNPQSVKAVKKYIRNMDAIDFIGAGTRLGFDFAILGGDLHRERGCVGVLANIERFKEQFDIAHSRMRDEGYKMTYWNILLPRGHLRDRINSAIEFTLNTCLL